MFFSLQTPKCGPISPPSRSTYSHIDLSLSSRSPSSFTTKIVRKTESLIHHDDRLSILLLLYTTRKTEKKTNGTDAASSHQERNQKQRKCRRRIQPRIVGPRCVAPSFSIPALTIATSCHAPWQCLKTLLASFRKDKPPQKYHEDHATSNSIVYIPICGRSPIHHTIVMQSHCPPFFSATSTASYPLIFHADCGLFLPSPIFTHLLITTCIRTHTQPADAQRRVFTITSSLPVN